MRMAPNGVARGFSTLCLAIDDNVIAEYANGIPDDRLFSAVSFSMANVGGENARYYITNVRITNH